MSSHRPQLFTRGLSGLSQSHDPNSPGVSSPAEQRDGAKMNFLKTMRPLPTQHYWDVYFDRQPAKDKPETSTDPYQSNLEKLDIQIASVQDFWRYANNTPVTQIKMRESLYLFKSGFKPVWEDRRSILGGSWTIRVPKAQGPEIWNHVQMLAIGEQLQASLEEGDQLAGVGISVRFNSHLVTIWHRESSKKGSVDGIIRCVTDSLPDELKPKEDNYYYKRHRDHAGFKAPPELQAVIDSQDRAAAAAEASKLTETSGEAQNPVPAEGQPQVTVLSPQ